jgi:hypothetical protein
LCGGFSMKRKLFRLASTLKKSAHFPFHTVINRWRRSIAPDEVLDPPEK